MKKNTAEQQLPAAQHQTPAAAMSIDGHVATLAAIFANRLRRVAGRHYRKAYDMGIVEWRILICLGQHPGISALQVTRLTDLNKAAVSRTLIELRRKGWITLVYKTEKSRTGLIHLTDAGRELYANLAVDARARQEHLLAPLAAAEREAFVDMLHRLIAHVPGWGKHFERLDDAAAKPRKRGQRQ